MINIRSSRDLEERPTEPPVVFTMENGIEHYVLVNSMAMNGQGHAELLRNAIVCMIWEFGRKTEGEVRSGSLVP